MFRLVNIFIILTIVTTGSSTNIQLLKDYIDSNEIAVVLLVSCEKYDDLFTIKSIENLQHHGLWTNVLDISKGIIDIDYHRFFGRYSRTPLVVLNLECNQTKAFMAEMSKRIFFHHERKWFMLSESLDEAFDILNKENVNFDAEIMLAIPVRQDLYDIYEVYNPSFKRGGRLNISFMGNWSLKFGWNVVKQTKNERRNDLNGITFPAVIPVIHTTRATNIILFSIFNICF